MNDSPAFCFSRILAAVVVALSSFAGASAAPPSTDPIASGTNPPNGAPSNNAGSNGARDRNDTIRSNETRVNTVGKGVDPSTTKASQADRLFIEKAATRGLAELRMARLAVERSTEPRVRSFAQQLVSTHERTNAELSVLAGKKGVSFSPDDSDRQLKGLTDKKGAEFDQKFINQIVEEHTDDLALFDKASHKSDDPEVGAFASKQLPVVQENQRVAQETGKLLKR